MEGAQQKSYLPMLMWTSMVAFFMYQFIARSSFPTVLTEEYKSFFGLDNTGIGVLVSCYYFLYTFAQIPVGIVVDKYSVRLVATVSIFLCAIGILLFIATHNYYIAGIGQMLVGLGASSAFITTMKTIVNWFPENRRAMMLSFAISIGCLGPVVCGPLVAKVVQFFNWRSVMFAFSIIGFILTILIWNIVRDREDMPHEEKSKEAIPLFQSLKSILSSPQILILSLFALVQYAPLSALADLWGTSYIKKLYDADPSICSLANNMIYFGMVVGSPIWSQLALKLSSYKKPIVISIFCAALIFSIVVFMQVPLSVFFFLFFALGFSCSAMLMYPLGTALFPHSMAGTISGVINMGSMLSGVILMPLIGFLIDHSWDGVMYNGVKIYRIVDFRFGFMAVLVSLILGFIFSLMIKDRSPDKID